MKALILAIVALAIVVKLSLGAVDKAIETAQTGIQAHTVSLDK